MPQPQSPSLGPNLALLAASTLTACLVLGAIEIGLRWIGLGDVDPGTASSLKYQQVYLPLLEPGQRADGTRVWRPADIRLPYQSILLEKPEDRLRIITVGGSATAGLGYSPNATFARYLEHMLREAAPDQPVEITNLGIVALASRQVKLVVADALRRYEPNVVIVYSGNNEFLELHAEKFAALRRGVFDGFLDWLRDTNLRRVADRVVHGPPTNPVLDEQDFANDQLRVTEARIIRDVDVTAAQMADAIDGYERNLEAMAKAAQDSGAALILMTVASNWKWRGRSDLPDDWLVEVLGEDAPAGPAAYRRAIQALTGRLATAPAPERWELLFRRAVAAEQLRDFDSARRDYRAAMNADPHLRRALDEMNDRVRRVALRHGISLVDSVELLASQAENGIVGFGEFYDYVHFTPRGAMWVAAALLDELRRLGLVSKAARFDAARFVSKQQTRLASAEADALGVEDWLGFSFEKALLWDRDLWKYERMVKGLDASLARNSHNIRALVYRGNAHFFDLRGAAAAERDYRNALEVAPERSEIRANLERLLAEGRL
jgi:tetratricopeptide (TPR) repeat protein